MSHPSSLSPAEALDVLSVYLDVDQEVEIREAALNDERVPEGIVDALFRTMPGDRRDIALTRCTRSPVLRTWSASDAVEDRIAVAFNPHTPADVLHGLAHDAEPRVRAQVAFNPRADAASLQRLFDDPSPLVRDAVQVAFETEFGHELRKGERMFDLCDPVDG